MRRTLRRSTALLVLSLLVMGSGLAPHVQAGGADLRGPGRAAAHLLADTPAAGYAVVPTWSSAVPLGYTPLEPTLRHAGASAHAACAADVLVVARTARPSRHPVHYAALRLRTGAVSSYSTSLPPPANA
jgi:hypothetical protein